MTDSQSDPNARPTFEQRMEGLGRDMEAAGKRLGAEAEAAGQRLAQDPAVSGAASAATIAFGLVVLAVGAWFFADVTLGYQLPAVAWGDLWPVALIVIGLAVVLRSFWRRA